MRVGTSINQAVNDYRNKDHPHACGDKRNIVLPLRPVIGSSPCVWGQEGVAVLMQICDRIIPMRVGTSPCSPQLPQVAEDHPHACGDKNEYFRGCIHRRGSSPCVWGQDNDFVSSLTKLRIIPMRVGTSAKNC